MESLNQRISVSEELSVSLQSLSHRPIAVSYTHLDVYKRQVLYYVHYLFQTLANFIQNYAIIKVLE